MRRPGEEQKGEKETRRRGRPTLIEQLGRQGASSAGKQRIGSAGSILEVFKRKRIEEEKQSRLRAEKEILENFYKLRKVGRSPQKTKEEDTAGGRENRQR